MPEANDKPHEEHGQVHGDFFAFFTAETTNGFLTDPIEQLRLLNRIEDIVLAPGSQSNVPPPPEFRHGTGKERRRKIIRQCNTEDLSHTDYNVHASREVTIELKCKQDRGNRNIKSVIKAVITENGIHRNSGAFGDDELFEKAPEDSLGAACQILIRKGSSGGELRSKLFVAADRPGGNLREEAAEYCKTKKAALRLQTSVIDADEVTEQLQCVEGNSERSNGRQIRYRNRNMKCGQNVLRTRKILKCKQEAEIQENRQDINTSGGSRTSTRTDEARCGIDTHNGCSKEAQSNRKAPKRQKKNNVCRKEQSVLESARNQIIYNCQKQAESQKFTGNQSHSFPLDKTAAKSSFRKSVRCGTE